MCQFFVLIALVQAQGAMLLHNGKMAKLTRGADLLDAISADVQHAASLSADLHIQEWARPSGLDSSFIPRDLTVDFRMFSKADERTGLFDLVLQTKRKGWILFGLSEMGSTKGSDLMLAHVDGTNVHTHDLFTGHGSANVDKCGNEWKSLRGLAKDGESLLHVQRPLKGKSKIEDRDISCGSYEHVLYHVGAAHIPYSDENVIKAADTMLSTIRKAQEDNKFSFGTTDTVLCGKDPLNSVKGAEEIELRQQGVAVPKAHTTIMCHGFKLQGAGHVVAMQPIITPGSPVHHFHLHRCRNNKFFQTYDDRPHTCIPPSFGEYQKTTQCVGSAYTYLAGQSGPFVLPPEAGIEVGDDVDNGQLRFLVLEIHYDNPTHIEGLKDHSGLRIWREHTPRKYAAALLGLADPFAELNKQYNFDQHDKKKKRGIPPGKKNFEIQASCTPECTATWARPITIFASMMHAHLIAKALWTDIVRNGKKVSELQRVNFFSHSKQQLVPVNHTIHPGDRLTTHCVYDSTSRSKLTKIGPATTMEMCMNAVWYYPRLDAMWVCGTSKLDGMVECGKTWNRLKAKDVSKTIEESSYQNDVKEEEATC
jgi:hypothetical protein